MRRTLFLALALIARLAFADCSGTTANLGLADCTTGTPRSTAELAWLNNFKLLDLGANSPLSISGAGSPSPTIVLGTVPLTKGGVGIDLSSITKGGTLHADADGSVAILAPNVTTTTKYRYQVGNASAVTSDGWQVIPETDLPAIRLSALTQIDPSLCAPGETVVEVGGTSWACAALASGGHVVQDNGSDQTQRGHLNFIGATVSDNSGNDSTDVTIGGGGLFIAFPCQLTAGSTDFCGPATSPGNTQEAFALVRTTSAGSFTKMYCGSNVAPGAGPETITYTAYKNGSGQTITCAQSGGSSFNCADTSHSFSYSAGDNIYVKAVSSSSSAAVTATCSLS